VGGTFVVDDGVVALGPVGALVHREPGARGTVVRVDLGDFQVGARFKALLEHIFLFRVIVAASAGDEQDTQGLGLRGGCADREGKQGDDGKDERGFHGRGLNSRRLKEDWGGLASGNSCAVKGAGADELAPIAKRGTQNAGARGPGGKTALSLNPN